MRNDRLAAFALFFFLLLEAFLIMIPFRFAGAYDPMDPQGNVTIKWDVLEKHDSGYTARVTLFNYQLYRHMESPGWKLGWTWPDDDVIWFANGAEATQQGNCSRFIGNLPHSCEKNPIMIDLLPVAPYNLRTANCCKGGALSSLNQDPSNSLASFQISVGAATNLSGSLDMPSNFSLGVPGYTCSSVSVVEPTKFQSASGRRYTQALETWEVICTYSQFRESQAPLCCVSLSAFYNESIVPCPYCSCGCMDPSTCQRAGKRDSLLELDREAVDAPPAVLCTDHMCPIQVHWHVKTNYREYWRVKMTVHNLNMLKNYSQWNLVVQHPNMESLTQSFSFNYKPLVVYGDTNDTGMFWGVEYYNDLLLQQGESGNVQTEVLFQKIPGEFTLMGGWVFPRRISFNGHQCVMPPPDAYPSLSPAAAAHVSGSAAAAPRQQRLSSPLVLLLSSSLLLLLLLF